MSAVADFFQNLGSVLTFGLIPPAEPDEEKVDPKEVAKVEKKIAKSTEAIGLEADKHLQKIFTPGVDPLRVPPPRPKSGVNYP